MAEPFGSRSGYHDGAMFQHTDETAMLTGHRRRRALVLEALESRAKQFRSREDSWPFRMPHDPLDLDAIIDAALADDAGPLPHDALRTRGVLRMEWAAGDAWDLWAVTLASGLHLYCDSDGHESRVLASARRGNPSDADGFFLERLAESRGHLFGIEMAGAPPDRVKSSIGDRAFLADVFVELFEGTEAERGLGAGPDFYAVVVGWLDQVLTAPPMTRRQPRVRNEDPSAL
jgi:hypothetical protein